MNALTNLLKWNNNIDIKSNLEFSFKISRGHSFETKCDGQLNWVSHLWPPACSASLKQVQKCARKGSRGHNPFKGLHMLAHPNTCETSFIAILKPLQIFYAQNERKSRGQGNVVGGGGSNSTFFDSVLRHYHPRLSLHMWLGSRNVFPQPVLDDMGHFTGSTHAWWRWTTPRG